MLATKKHQIALVILILAVTTGVYFLSRDVSRVDSLQSKMLDSITKHDHESALLYANQLLKVDPSNNEARRIITQSGQIFYFLSAAKSVLTDENQNTSMKPEHIYKRLTKAREYIIKAKVIDPRAISVRHFEQTLVKIQTNVVQALSMKTLEVTQAIIEKKSSNYKKAQEIANKAESSRYLSNFLPHQSAWASVASSSSAAKQAMIPELDKLEEISRLISDDKQAISVKPVKLLRSYIEQVKVTADTLLIPAGSYDAYLKAASSTLSDYNNLRNKLTDTLSGTIVKSDVLTDLLNTIQNDSISRNQEVATIINDHKSLYTQ